MSRRALGLAVGAACAVLVVSCVPKAPPRGIAPTKGPQKAQKASRKNFVIAGTVTDSEGLPVRGLGVEVLVSAKPLLADPRLDRGAFQIAARGQTGADGVYRLEFFETPPAKRYYLNFYVPDSFDEVRFARPSRMEITKIIGEKPAFLFDYRLQTHAKWEQVQKLSRIYPPTSGKGRIIRRFGIAEEIRKKKDDSEVEVWWYYTKGKSFSFRADKLEGETSFRPVFK